METTQNRDNDGRGQRELTILVMASTVVRTVFWLPLQIFVLADVFGPEPETKIDRRKWELLCVCAALTGSCLLLPLLRVASTECRQAIRTIFRRSGCCDGGGSNSPENRHNLPGVLRYQSEPGGPACSPSLTAAMLHRQCSYPPNNEFDTGRPKHLSLPPGGRLSSQDVSETILSIISDSSNHINYA